ncbi:MAG: FAD-dependent oxidoreductase, partial [Lentisphaeria bacterium]
MKIQVPIIKQVDLLVAGGSTVAVEKAVALQQSGHTVFLFTPYPYLGEDLCAKLNLHETPDNLGLGDNPRPAAIKQRLEQKLLDAGIDFLFQCNPIRLVYGKHNELAGLLIGNRSGFQIIAAKAVLDATNRNLIADLAGLPRKPFRPGKRQVERIVMGEYMTPSKKLYIEPLPCHYSYDEKSYQLFKTAIEMDFPDNSPCTLSKIEVQMRKETWQPQLVLGADQCHYQLNDGISISYCPSPESPFFFDTKNSAKEIAESLSKIPYSEPVYIQNNEANEQLQDMKILRNDTSLRFQKNPTLEFELNSLPLLDHCQVLIAGGGTGGAPAAIAAARTGAKTICIEHSSALGGICTIGRIGSYYYGNRVGFCEELDQGVTAMAENPKYPAEHGVKDTEWKRHWLLLEGNRAGAEFRFQHSVLAAATQQGKVCGALVSGPWGSGIIQADTVVDATGNADLAIAAGAEIAVETFEPAVQGAGLSPIVPGIDCSNTDYNFIQDEDVFDATRAFVQAHHKF